MLAHQAAAKACETALKREAARTFAEEGSADTWRMPGTGMVVVSVSHDRAAVTDEQAFLGWLEKAFPTEVVTETVTVRSVRNPEWLKHLLGELLPVDPDELGPGEATICMDGEGSVIPGVQWRRGGEFLSASVRPDSDVRRRLAAAAEAYALRGEPMPGIAATRDESAEVSR